jgi:hypothetical protein
MIFVDSNIVIDLIEDGEWTAWSKRALERDTVLVSNHIVFAEVSRAFPSPEAVATFLRELGIELMPMTSDVAFDAGRAMVGYRMSGGRHNAILADFLIAAHAQRLGASLATRDRRRFPRYFPNLTLITPETHPHG